MMKKRSNHLLQRYKNLEAVLPITKLHLPVLGLYQTAFD